MASLAHLLGIRIRRAGQQSGVGIGAGILLIALGAILAFAVDWKIAGLDMQMVGWVLMGAGALGLVLFFVFWNRRRSAIARPEIREP